MIYDDFVKAIDWTIHKWSHAQPTYETLRKRGDAYWLQLENLSQKQIENEIIIGFLNTGVWSCHLDSPLPKPPRHNGQKGQLMVKNLKVAVDSLPLYYQQLGKFSLFNIDFTNPSKMNLWMVAKVFSEFKAIKPRFGPVPASKLMHMALPDLLMMWDNAIFKKYGVPSDALGRPSYLAFQILMQQNMNHIINSCSYSNGNPNILVTQINSQFNFQALTFPRLLDIANYAVAHSGLINVCGDCIGATNKIIQKINQDQHLSALGIHQF